MFSLSLQTVQQLCCCGAGRARKHAKWGMQPNSAARAPMKNSRTRLRLFSSRNTRGTLALSCLVERSRRPRSARLSCSWLRTLYRIYWIGPPMSFPFFSTRGNLASDRSDISHRRGGVPSSAKLEQALERTRVQTRPLLTVCHINNRGELGSCKAGRYAQIRLCS